MLMGMIVQKLSFVIEGEKEREDLGRRSEGCYRHRGACGPRQADLFT